ncbi:MAG: hypothetical protein K0S68_309 [Candidatus Saccharibacteria bacterium]|nr:hypothetical protein [Candidatus Saccharibacteria bacterium]
MSKTDKPVWEQFPDKHVQSSRYIWWLMTGGAMTGTAAILIGYLGFSVYFLAFAFMGLMVLLGGKIVYDADNKLDDRFRPVRWPVLNITRNATGYLLYLEGVTAPVQVDYLIPVWAREERPTVSFPGAGYTGGNRRFGSFARYYFDPSRKDLSPLHRRTYDEEQRASE